MKHEKPPRCIYGHMKCPRSCDLYENSKKMTHLQDYDTETVSLIYFLTALKLKRLSAKGERGCLKQEKLEK